MSEPEAHSDTPRPKRRPRYRGTHPRRFDEKYKERNPLLYPETVAKVMASGKTPAGMHRPICVAEILEILNPQPGQILLDATLGYGGHTRELVQRVQPGGKVIALDVDPLELPPTEARLRAEGFTEDQLILRRRNYAGFLTTMTELGISGFDGILADLGCSSMQFDNPDRGFSFKQEGPLDLRMNPQRGLSATELIQRLSQEKLEKLLKENSDEPFSQEISKAMIDARSALTTTSALTRIIRESIPRHVSDSERDTSVRRVFQALRIEVNEEFTALETFLRSLPHGLRSDGKVTILTFHSGEDRRVKKSFQAGFRDGTYSEIANEVIRPSAEETRSNPRASCAKLRWAIRA